MSSQAEGERTVAIYASVIRQLVTKDHTFGGADPGFKVIYVLDGVVENAEDPTKAMDEHDPAKRFAAGIREGLRKELADLPPVTFVQRRSSVIEGDKAGSSPGRVINDGVLLSLGPIVGDASKVEVGNNLWINGLAGQWLTYVLQVRGGEWSVTGTTGPVAIS